MITAIILAGGSGQRMGQSVPKQFIEVEGKPVLVYTLESFQRHPAIDAIEVVCREGWADTVREYRERYGLTKIRWIVPGGETAQESIRNGLLALENQMAEDDMVVIHDGIRPLIEEEILTDVIHTCERFGNAVSSLPYNEQIFTVCGDDTGTTEHYIPRETLRRVVTPQAYLFGTILRRYREAYEKGIGISGSVYANTLMVEMGERLHFAAGSEKNIKLTTPDDLMLFRALLRMERRAGGSATAEDTSGNGGDRSSRLYQNRMYQEDLETICGADLPWEKLKGRSLLISGASGMIGSCLTDALMTMNRRGLDCTVYALCRDRQRAAERFSAWRGDGHLRIIQADVNDFFDIGKTRIDFAIHLASNTHPLQYARDPIGTIRTNVVGLENMLAFASEQGAKRFLFASSNEIYGEKRGDTELFAERDCGYIDCNTLRAGYPESKRCGEALCQAYREQKHLDAVIARVTRTYGPTMRLDDSKAASQFIRKAAAGENVVLKSAGEQYYSFTYVADAVTGLLTVLIKGGDGEAYNVADMASDIRLRDLAGIAAEAAGTRVVYEKPERTEQKGYSAATVARLDGSKLKRLGWKPAYDIRTGIGRTVAILRDLNRDEIQEEEEERKCEPQ